MTIEECIDCENEFDVEQDDGYYTVTGGHFVDHDYLCSSCFFKRVDEKESLDAAHEDYGIARTRGEL